MKKQEAAIYTDSGFRTGSRVYQNKALSEPLQDGTFLIEAERKWVSVNDGLIVNSFPAAHLATPPGKRKAYRHKVINFSSPKNKKP